MRVIQIDSSFGLERLRLAERPRPEPGPGEIRVRLRAASINYRDLLMIGGRYDPRQRLPLVPCSDGAGVVDAVGEGVEQPAVGDRVVTMFAQGWLDGRPEAATMRATLGGPLDGTLAEWIVLRADGVAPAPAHLSHVEAASLPCAGLTAWSALTGTTGRAGAGVGGGDTVLVQGTGGVSIFALQLARRLGARVIATSGNDEKLARVRELGAWHTINYRDTPDWGRAAREAAAGGVDHVIEVGGAGTLQESIAAVRPGGTISLIGVLAGGAARVDLVPVLMRQIRVQGVLVGHRTGFVELCRMLEAGDVHPLIDRVFDWTEARSALEWLAAGRHVGKVALRFGDDATA